MPASIGDISVTGLKIGSLNPQTAAATEWTSAVSQARRAELYAERQRNGVFATVSTVTASILYAVKTTNCPHEPPARCLLKEHCRKSCNARQHWRCFRDGIDNRQPKSANSCGD